MNFATRTSEGFPVRCRICGKGMLVAASSPLADIVCPHCGSLAYPDVEVPVDPADDEFQLAERGIFVETNDEGEITLIRLRGAQFNDQVLDSIVKFQAVPQIDVTLTPLSREAIAYLRERLPGTQILCDRDEPTERPR